MQACINFYQSNNMLFLVLVVLQVADIITGLLNIDKYNFDHNRLRSGVFHKGGDWIAIALGFLIAHCLVLLGDKLSIDFRFSKALGWIVLAASMYKECRSVMENLEKLGVVLPGVIKRVLSLAESNVDGTLNLQGVDNGMELKLDKSLSELEKGGTIHIKINNNPS